MENQDKSTPEATPRPKEQSLESKLLIAEVTADLCKEEMKRQYLYIQQLEQHVKGLEQRIAYLTLGGVDYEQKTWIQKVVQCIEDAEEEVLSAAEILHHLEQRDKENKLDCIKDPRKMLSVVLHRGVKAHHLYTADAIGTARMLYGVN